MSEHGPIGENGNAPADGAGAGPAEPATSSDGPPDPAMPAPRSIVNALAAIYTQLVFAALSALLAFPLSQDLRTSIVDSNNRAGSNKKALCVAGHAVKNCLNVTGTLHSLQLRSVIGTVIVGAAIIVAVVRIRRGVRSGRTMFVIFSFLGTLILFAGTPVNVAAAFTSGPVPPRIVETIAGVSAVVAIVLLWLAPSQRYFEARSPRTGRGFGSLFSAPPPGDRKQKPSTGLRSTAASRAQGRLERSAQRRDVEAIARSAAQDRSRAKSKARNDAEAVARGAALARDRAKASKSRRSER